MFKLSTLLLLLSILNNKVAAGFRRGRDLLAADSGADAPFVWFGLVWFNIVGISFVLFGYFTLVCSIRSLIYYFG
jgi:hypothetical protein